MILRGHVVSVVLVCAALAFSATVLHASDAKQTDAQALLDKAEQLSRLTTKGASPFVFQAKIQYGEGPTHASAIFFLVWADGDHWRATAVDAARREVYVRNPEGMWLPRVPDPGLITVFGDGMIFPFKRSLLDSEETIDGMRQREIDGQTLSCVRLHGKSRHRELCMDPKTGLLQRGSARPGRLAGPEVVTEFRDYSKEGEHWVPRQIRRMMNGQLVSDLRLLRLAFDAPTSGDWFATPPGHEAWPDCDRYQPPSPSTSVEVPRNGVGGERMVLGGKLADEILIKVGADGESQDVRLVRPTSNNAYLWAAILSHQHFRPATCGGKPVMGYFLMHPFVPQSDMLNHGLPYFW
ncbi:MAG: hypothetical protein ACHP8B_08895 [Terriglobales bacterium]